MSTPNWWGDWRPNLPAHSGDLQATDLIECTSIVGGVPVNTAMTGAQIIAAASGGGASWGTITGTLSAQSDLQTALNGKQDTLVSSTNIKTINSQSLLGSGNIYINPKTISANGLNLTGTANQISASVRIAGGTLVANNTIHIRSICTKSAGTTGSQVRLYINTTNSLTGATQIATGATMSTTNYIQNFWRNFYFDGSSLYLYSTGNPLSTDLTQGPISYYSLNSANDYYLLFAVQNSTASPDNLGHRKVIVQIYD